MLRMSPKAPAIAVSTASFHRTAFAKLSGLTDKTKFNLISGGLVSAVLLPIQRKSEQVAIGSSAFKSPRAPSSSFFALTGRFQRGAFVVPSEDYSHQPPRLHGLLVKGDRPKTTRLPQQYGLAEVVGKWVWLDVSPTSKLALAGVLWALGFHWNQRRGVWQHPCGKFDPLGSHPTDPRAKYRSYFPADAQAA
jgi:hypothetical protein